MFHYIPRLLKPLNPCPENCIVIDDFPFKPPFAGDVPFISKDSINIIYICHDYSRSSRVFARKKSYESPESIIKSPLP
jgi:hypothetical protein